MSVQRWLTSLTLLSLGLACGGGGGNNGGGGNTPSLSISPPSANVIAGGSPVNFTATFANTTGSATWNLTGPGSMSVDPSNPNSARYTPPASVASSTSATLTATSGTLTASATITVNPPPTITVAGKVTDLAKKGVPSATVAIGAQHATTDAAGAFSIAGVTAPYDAIVIVPDSGRNAVIVFKGLTRVDPTLLAFPLGGSAPPNSGTVSGSVSGGDAFPAPSDKTAAAWGSPEATSVTTFTSNPWSMTLHWDATPTATTGNVHALQWTPTTGIPAAYKGYGVASGLSVSNGTTTSGVAIAMSAPAASTVGGSVSVPAGMTLMQKSLSIDFADGASFTVGTDATAATSFSYPVPSGIGSTASVSAQGLITGTAASLTRSRGLAAGSTGSTVNLLSPAVQSTPVVNATGISTSTDFTWTPLAGAVHLVGIGPNTSPTAPIYYFFTTGTTIRIPDLGSLGVVLPATTVYDWAIIAFGPWASIDEFAGGSVLTPNGNTLNTSFTADRSFTTQ